MTNEFLSDPFVLLQYIIKPSPVACNFGDHHLVNVVSEKMIVRLVETKPAKGAWGESVLQDAGWRCENWKGDNFYSNWGGVYDDASYTGIHNLFSDEGGNTWWALKYNPNIKADKVRFVSEDGEILSEQLLAQPNVGWL